MKKIIIYIFCIVISICSVYAAQLPDRICFSLNTGDFCINGNGDLNLSGNLNVDGDVGIGTTIPQNKLNVIGDGNFTGNLYGGTVYSGGSEVLTSYTETDPHWTGNQSSYFTKSDILGFSYYNLTSFDIADYYLKSNPFSFVNTSTVSNFNYLILSKWANITDAPTTLSFFTDDLGNRGYTHLTNFTDDLGNRGYTHLTNFTDDILWTTGFNATGDSRWLTSFTETDPKWTGNYTSRTGTGNVVFSASPTFTGTVGAAAITMSGLLTANGGITADGGVFTVADTTGAIHTGNNLDVDGVITTGSTPVTLTGATGYILETAITQNSLDDSEIEDNSLTAGSLAPDSVSDSELDGGFGWTLDTDLNIDSNTLVVSYDDNRVGIGTSSPSAQLHTTSGVRFQGLANDFNDRRIVTSDTSGNLAYRDLENPVSFLDAPSGQYVIYTPTFNNLFYSGDKRFNVTQTGLTNFDASKMFDGNYDQSAYNQITTNDTEAVINISLIDKGEFGTSSGLTYSYGWIYVHFYIDSPTEVGVVKARVKSKNAGGEFIWRDYAYGTNISSTSYVLIKIPLFGNYYTSDIQIVVTSATLNPTPTPAYTIDISEIEFIVSRSAKSYAQPVVSKTLSNSLFGTTYWRNSNNVVKAQITPSTGTAYFAGNVGIGTTTPQQHLHINGSAVINGTLNMDSNKIISLGNGTSAQDAITLSQLQAVNESAVAEETDPYWTGNQSLVYLKSNPFSFINTTTASNLNYLILSKWANITGAPTALSFFTDDLGDRGYTHLTNFTDDILWTSGFNATGDARWLGVGEETDPKWTGNYTSRTGTGNVVFSASPTFTGTVGAAAITATGTVTANSFTGAGTGLTGTAASLTAGAGDSATAFFSTGTLEVARGGTGISSYTTGNYIRASGATSLEQRTPAQVRGDIGATTVGGNLFTLTNPSAIRFIRTNADNTVSALTAADFRTAIGAGTGDGTVTSISQGTGMNFSTTPITTTGTINLANTAVTPGSYGSNIAVGTFTVDQQGRLTAAGSTTIRSGTTAQTGVVQLTNSVSSTSTTTAAVPANVKTAYDTATAKASPGTCSSGQVVQNTTTGGVQCVDIDKASAVNGTGTSNTIAKFTGTTTIGDSKITDDGTIVAVNTSDLYINTTSGNVGIGISNPTTLLQISNDGWISAKNYLGTGTVNMFKVNENDSIEVGATLNIGSFEFNEDSGLVTFVDMPVSSTPAAGTSESYVFKVDGDNIMTIYSEADGSGGVQNKRVGIGTITPQNTLNVIGDGNFTGSLYGGTVYSGGSEVLTSFTETDPYWTGNWTGLTASRLATTDASKNLASTITLANVVSSISDVSGSTGTTNLVLSASPTFTGTVTIPSPFTLGAISVTTTGTRLNYLTSAGGTTGTTSTNLVFSTSPTITSPTISTSINLPSNAVDAAGEISNDIITNAHFTHSTDWGDVATDGSGLVQIESGVVGTSEITDGAIAEVDLKIVDAASDEDVLTYETTTGDFEWHSASEIVTAGGGITSELDPLWTGNQSSYYNKTYVYNTTEIDAFSLSHWTDDLGDRGYTHLTNFTDNLGNRGYTHLTNFTDDILWTSGFNATGDARWLGVGDETDPLWTGNQSSYWDTSTDLDTVISADEISEANIAFSTACGPGNHYYLNGNDLACEADDDTTYTASGTLLNLTGTTFSVNEGTLTNAKGCKFVTGTGIVCDQDYLTSFTETDPKWTGNWTGLTASRLATTDASKNLASTITLANLVSSISDVSGSTGTTNLVLSASPTFTGSVTIPSTADDATYTGIVTNDGGVLKYRTKAQILSDIGAEPTITAGTTAQYWRGDKTWQTLLGTTSTTAYRGDYGNTAYTHSQIAGGNSVHVSTTENTQWDTAYTHSQIAGGNSVHVSTTENTNWDAAYNHISATGASHSYINQAVTTTSNPTFAGLTLTGGYLDDDTTLGGLTDDWLRINSYIEMRSATDSYGIVLRDKDTSSYFGITQVVGASYLSDSAVYSSYFLKGDGANAWVRGTLEVGDHTTADVDKVVNVVFDTTNCPTASTTTRGTLCVVY